MNATTHQLGDLPPSRCIAVVLTLCHRVVRATPYDVVATYVVGSSVPKLATGQEIGASDIDLVFFLEQDIERGVPILEADDLRQLVTEIGAEHDVGLGCYSNGNPVTPISPLMLDIVPARLSDVANRSPHVVIDMCQNDNIHVLGSRLLDDAMGLAVTPKMAVERMRLTERYLDRELNNTTEVEHYVGYILKCFVFSTELAMNLTLHLDSPAEVVDILSGAGLHELHDVMLQAVQASEGGDASRLLVTLKRYHALLADELTVGGFLVGLGQ